MRPHDVIIILQWHNPPLWMSALEPGCISTKRTRPSWHYSRLMRSQPGDRRGRSSLHYSVVRELGNSCAQSTLPQLTMSKEILHWIWLRCLRRSIYIHMSQNVSFLAILETCMHLWKMQPRRIQLAIIVRKISVLHPHPSVQWFLRKEVFRPRNDERSIQVRKISCPVRWSVVGNFGE